MEKIKSLEDYTKEEWDSLDAGTQADILWAQRDRLKVQTLKESLREYELKKNFIY